MPSHDPSGYSARADPQGVDPALQSIRQVSSIVIVNIQFNANNQAIATTFYEPSNRNEKESQFVEIFIKYQAREIKQLPRDLGVTLRRKCTKKFKLLIDL